MTPFSMDNPVFTTYVIASAIMILKLMAQGWITAPDDQNRRRLAQLEDLQAGPANVTKARATRAQRLRRPLAPRPPQRPGEHPRLPGRGPDLRRGRAVAALGANPTYVFVATRLAHTLAYMTGQRHELRASLYSVGSIVVIAMAVYALVVALA